MNDEMRLQPVREFEVGHIVFGEPQGEYRIPRGVGWEDELYRLFDVIGLDSYGWGPNEEEGYENNIFWVQPYWWGDCTCGWDDIDDGHKSLMKLEHRPDCFHIKYLELRKHYDPFYNKMSSEELWLRKLKELYREFGLPTEGDDFWHGVALICTCDYYERAQKILERYAEEFGHMGHKPDCKLVRPNFHHKPSGLSVWWYKYPLRDATANKPITLKEFRKIIDECIRSVKGG